MYVFECVCVCSFVYSFIRLFVYSFIRSFVNICFCRPTLRDIKSVYINTNEEWQECSKQCNDLYSKQFLLYNQNIARLASSYASNAPNIFKHILLYSLYTIQFFGYHLNLLIRFSCCSKFQRRECVCVCVHRYKIYNTYYNYSYNNNFSAQHLCIFWLYILIDWYSKKLSTPSISVFIEFYIHFLICAIFCAVRPYLIATFVSAN